MGPAGFPKRARLRSRFEFEALQQQGGRLSRKSVLALWRCGGKGRARLGITASSKVGNSVVRNTAKRWIREWFRNNQTRLPPGLDLVLIVRRGAVAAGHPALDADLSALIGLLGRSLTPPSASREERPR